MDTNNMTLGNVIRGRGQQREGHEQVLENLSFNTFLTLFSINLTHRFPDVSDIDSIDYRIVRNIADLSIVASSVALDVWQENLVRDQKTVARQSRAA